MSVWLRWDQIHLGLEEDPAGIPERLAKQLGLPRDAVLSCTIRRKALDARGDRKPVFILTIEFALRETETSIERILKNNPSIIRFSPPKPHQIQPGDTRLNHRPVIIGAGPAGLMAALRLAEAGYQPLLLERGGGLEERVRAVESFWRAGELDLENNTQFGAGGAGTFSDGKLVTRIKDPAALTILEVLTDCGGPEEIRYEAKPHLGTDRLRGIVRNLESRIREAGGEIRYHTKVEGITLNQNRIQAMTLADGSSLPAEALLLAVGNSARELFEEFNRVGIALEAKPIAIGLRIEHPQAMIDHVQYGRWAGHPRLGAADYHLTHRVAAQERGVYSFCMCPGGAVIAAASERDGVVTNGMSLYARDSGLANAALVVSVRADDYDGNSPLAGVTFQRYWEREAFRVGGGGYYAPGQNAIDFIQGKPSIDWRRTAPSYRPGVTPGDLTTCLPRFVVDALREALRRFDRQIPGFVEAGVLTGIETRTSSPVRILRDQTYRSVNIDGIYPCGEGSGYAGGIVSAAVDGLRAAEAIITGYAPLD